jgi:hypothetical protein
LTPVNLAYTTVPAGSLLASAPVDAGVYQVAARFAGSANYNQKQSAPATITINQAGQTIIFTSTAPAGAAVGGPTYTVSATGGASGIAVTFGSSTLPVCTVSGSTVSFVGAGTCTITANQDGNTNYSAASPATQSFGVAPAPVSDNQAPIVSNTLALPVPMNVAGTVTATISDATTGNSNIKSWYYTVDGTAAGGINIASGSQAVTVNVNAALPVFTTPDVKEVCVYGTDTANNTSVKMDCTLLAVYDPSAGFITGGGWINAVAGSYTLNPTLSGKGTFGFVSKYQKGATVPSGNTEFQFHAAGMNFNSSVYEWLVVSGCMGQFKGTGTINGAGTYGFLLSAVDGQLSGGGGIDKFRIKIWNKATGSVVFDNNLGADETSAPATALGGGSISIKAK